MVAFGYPGDLLVCWFWWALAMVPLCFVVFQLVIGLTRPQANRRSARHCILCLLLDRGLLAYLPIGEHHQNCQGHSVGVRCRRLRRGAPLDDVFPRHVVKSNALLLLSASRLRHAS